MRIALALIFVTASAFGASAYDAAVRQDRPVLYLPHGSPRGSEPGRYFPVNGKPRSTRMPNGDVATVFDGYSQYVEIPSRAAYSIPRTGALTIEAWLRPDTLQFPSEESDGYVHWAGKGESGEQEWAGRMYSKNNSAHRPSRISGYVFNLSGGLGSGSYFQDPVRAGDWIFVAIVVDTRAGTVAIFKDGALRKSTPLSQFSVVPGEGNAPVRVATRDLHSFFKGAIGKFAVYGHALSEAKVRAHFLKMRP